MTVRPIGEIPPRGRVAGPPIPAWAGGADGRDSGGRFVAGNRASLKHGLRAGTSTLLAVQEGAAAALADRQREIEADLGGADRLSRVHRDAIRDLLRLELVSGFLFDKLAREGVLSAKGRTRASLSAYLAVADRLYRLRQLVGLERRQRPVDPLDAVRAAVARASSRPDDSGSEA